MARKPERERGAYKESGFLRTKKASLLWQYGPAKVVQAFTKCHSKLIPIEKKFFELFLKSCLEGRFSYISIQRVIKLWTLKVNRKPPGIGST